LPETAPLLESWLEDARRVDALKPRYLKELGVLTASALAGNWSDPASLSLSGRRYVTAAEAKQDAALESFLQATSGLEARIAFVTDRLAAAHAVEARALSGPEALARWIQAIEAVAKDDRFGGYRLTPQLGLLPLRPDPSSGFWEFAHLPSGEPPRFAAGAPYELLQESCVGSR